MFALPLCTLSNDLSVLVLVAEHGLLLVPAGGLTPSAVSASFIYCVWLRVLNLDLCAACFCLFVLCTVLMCGASCVVLAVCVCVYTIVYGKVRARKCVCARTHVTHTDTSQTLNIVSCGMSMSI